MKKKVLIITYYWPPSGGAGVQRWLKFAKYLPEFGVEPVIYTPSNPESPVEDNSLLEDIPPGIQVIKRKIFEPYSFYKIFTGKSQKQKVNAGFIQENKKTGFLESIAVWIRGNLFIPDARKFWVNPSVKFLKKFIAENQIETVISTGPPHSMHLIALQLKKELNIQWIADFRDPWTKVDYYHLLKTGKRADKKHRKLERKVISSADVVLTVSQSWAKDLEQLGGKKVKVITNGYDALDFKDISNPVDDEFSIVHIGTVHKERNPHNLWMVLQELLKNNPDFQSKLKIKLIGKVDFSVIEEMKVHGLEEFTERISYVQHNDIPKQMMRSRILLLLISRFSGSSGMIPGKVFEYLASGRPVLMLGNTQGDTARLIREMGVGEVCEYEDTVQMKSAVVHLFQRYQAGNDDVESADIERFERRALTRSLAEVIHAL
ncbi:MAG: glycosyltransferase family 4 protein [Bacteroidales bacterium]|nr:glycosyltransferase family 4 protein [Bacteroidales bacterium]